MDLVPGIYRGQSAGCFGLWRLCPNGQWLFSVPVKDNVWKRVSNPEDGYKLVLIASDKDTGPRDGGHGQWLKDQQRYEDGCKHDDPAHT